MLNFLTLIISIFILFLDIRTSFANENAVAKVIMTRGTATVKLTNGDIFEVKNNQEVLEKSIIQTGEKSFVKLEFIDKSLINIGPNSQMEVSHYDTNEAGILTLIKGQIRSQVTKEYMNIEDKNKSKLYIKTDSVALGVRGTDFQVNYNPVTHNASLITFEGKVAMSNIEPQEKNDHFDQIKLEHIVTNDKAVMVERGQIAGLNLNISERVMSPTRLAPIQLAALFKNETGIYESIANEKKSYRNPIPVGADSMAFSNLHNTKKEDVQDRNPDAFYNSTTHAYKFPAGAIIDLKNVNIIPPPSHAVFDPNSKTYIIPENYGQINKENGEYVAPTGIKVNSIPTIYNSHQEPVVITEKPIPTPPPTQLIDEKITTFETNKQKVIDLGTSTVPRKIKFIINAQ